MTIDYDDIKQIKIINENTKETIVTIRYLDGYWNIKSKTPYAQHIEFKTKRTN